MFFLSMVFLPHILRCYIVFWFFVFEQKLNSDKNLPQRQIFLVSSQNLPRRQFFCCLSPILTPVTDFLVFLSKTCLSDSFLFIFVNKTKISATGVLFSIKKTYLSAHILSKMFSPAAADCRTRKRYWAQPTAFPIIKLKKRKKGKTITG